MIKRTTKRTATSMPLSPLPLLFLLTSCCCMLVSGQSLKSEFRKCPSSEEGKYVRVRMPQSVVVDCKCEGGILGSCKWTEECDAGLKGCHHVVPGGVNSTCPNICKGCEDQNGDHRDSGETWMNPTGEDPCSVSTCFSGVVTSSSLRCPAPDCPDPVQVPGQCCPSCPRRGGNNNGTDKCEDSDDPCVECTCSSSSSSQQLRTCVRKVCPVLPCAPRLQRTPRGHCCPVCTRRREPGHAKVTSKLCLFRGKVYGRGRRTRHVDDCTTCVCGRNNLQVNCDRIACDNTQCAAATGLGRKNPRGGGQCCPECKASEAALAAVRPLHCAYRGRTYSDGAVWEDKCASCRCERGETRCQRAECPALRCPSDSSPVGPREGECCPRCDYTDGVCTVFGDPHYKTFDGRIFNFQGSCKYLLAQDCNGGTAGGGRRLFDGGGNGYNGNSTFSIRITNDARDSLAFSWLRTITVRLEDGVKVSLMQKMKVKVDGKRVSLPYIKLGSLSVMKDGYRVVLRTNTGVRLLWDGVSFLELSVPPKFRSRLCGLCGNFDGNRANDFYGRSGERHADGQTFGDDWRVGGLRACSVLPRDMPHSYEPQCTQTWEAKIRSERNCNALNSTLFHACRTRVDPSYYYNACKLDMCECPGGDGCHCEVLTAYARECERAGITVLRWREETGCVNVTSFSFRNSVNGINNEVVVPPAAAPSSKPVWQQQISSARLNDEQIKAEEGEGLGHVEAACTASNARHCQQQQTKETQNQHRRQRDRKLRRQERRRKRKEMRRLKKRLMRTGKKRRKKKKKKKLKNDDDNRRHYTNSRVRVRPPFEELLTSGGGGENQDLDDSDDASHSSSKADSSLLLLNNDYIASRKTSVDVSGRTPLPLFEDDTKKQERKRETAGLTPHHRREEVLRVPSYDQRHKRRRPRRRKGALSS